MTGADNGVSHPSQPAYRSERVSIDDREGSGVTASAHGDVSEAQTLRTLLDLVSAGDQAAFTRLYELTRVRIYGLAVSVVRDRHYAEEIVQEAYLQYWLKASNYNPDRGSVITWMTTIAYRRAVDRVRVEDLQTQRLAEYAAKAADPEESRNIPLEVAVQAAQAKALRTCLGQLTDLQRECLEMLYLADLTTAEIAARTHTPLPTIKSRKRAGLQRLKSCADIHRLFNA